MSAKQKDPLARYVPPLVAFELIMPAIALLASLLLPVLSAAKRSSQTFSVTALALAVVGVILLFAARLPLYRQRRWSTFGPRHLTGIHRRCYFVAYACLVIGIAVSLLLLCFSNP